MTNPQQLIFPPIQLKLGQTETTKTLYSATLSSRYGPGAQLQLYFVTRKLPQPTPATLSIMLYGNAAPTETDNTSVYVLRKVQVQQATSIRYDEQAKGDLSVGTVYFPKRMLGPDPPETCYLEVTFEPSSRQDSCP